MFEFFLFTYREPISLFGWTKGDKGKTTLVLTLSEKDVLAVQQATADYCVLSISKETQLPQEVHTNQGRIQDFKLRGVQKIVGYFV